MGCSRAVLNHLNELEKEKVPENELPKRLNTFCKASFDEKMHTLPGSIVTPSVQHRTCQKATGLVERRPIGKRFISRDQITKEYCYIMRDFFEWMLTQKNRGPPVHGEATSVSDINAQERDGRQSCCTPHQGGKCFDAEIAKCVCDKKHEGRAGEHSDDFCCNTEWDLSCVENVEYYGCGSCAAAQSVDDVFRR